MTRTSKHYISVLESYYFFYRQGFAKPGKSLCRSSRLQNPDGRNDSVDDYNDFSEVWSLIRLVLVMPATNAVSEQSFSGVFSDRCCTFHCNLDYLDFVVPFNELGRINF